MQELKRFTINLKSLDQDIHDPIVVGAGDADGRTLSVIFTQEAAARMTPSTLVYLSWKHNDTKIEGLNVFTKVNNKPETWEIHYPQSMLREGNVLACLKIIDEVSISTSTNFLIHVLSDPNTGENFEYNDDYSIFKDAALELNNTNKEMQKIKDDTINTLGLAYNKFNEKMEEIENLIIEIKNFLDNPTNEEGLSYLELIKRAKQEAILTSKEYTDKVLRLIEK